jgi:hypothetical protein
LTVNLPPTPSRGLAQLPVPYDGPLPYPNFHPPTTIYYTPHETPAERKKRHATEYRAARSALSGLRAEHIEPIGFLSQEHALPHASSSLVVYSAESYEWDEEPTFDVPDRLSTLLGQSHLFDDLDMSTIWDVLGFEPSDDMDYHMHYFMWWQAHHCTEYLVLTWLNHGHDRELRITIMPAGYVEGGGNGIRPSTEIFVVSLLLSQRRRQG